MKLKELKRIVDAAVEYAWETDADVEVWLGDTRLWITGLSQFTVVPDLVITVATQDSTQPHTEYKPDTEAGC